MTGALAKHPAAVARRARVSGTRARCARGAAPPDAGAEFDAYISRLHAHYRRKAKRRGGEQGASARELELAEAIRLEKSPAMRAAITESAYWLSRGAFLPVYIHGITRTLVDIAAVAAAARETPLAEILQHAGEELLLKQQAVDSLNEHVRLRHVRHGESPTDDLRNAGLRLWRALGSTPAERLASTGERPSRKGFARCGAGALNGLAIRVLAPYVQVERRAPVISELLALIGIEVTAEQVRETLKRAKNKT